MNEVLESTIVIRTIHKHLTEDHCIHNIREIMKEALESKSGLGQPTPEPNRTNQTDNQPIQPCLD